MTGQLNTRYLRGKNPDQLREDLLMRVRSNPARVRRELDNRVNLRWFMGQPFWYRAPGTNSKVIGMNPAARSGYIYPNLARDAVRTLSSVMTYEPDVDAFPSSSDPGDILRAETDQHMGRHILQVGQLADAYASVCEMNNIYSDGYIKVLWDPDAGARRPLLETSVCPVCSVTEVGQSPVGEVYRGAGPGSGAIYTNSGLQACFWCSAQGVDARSPGAPVGPLGQITQYLGTEPEGDVLFEAIHPDDVYVDPDATKWEDAEEVIHRIRLSPERAWTRYGKPAGVPQKFFEDQPRDGWTDATVNAALVESRPGDSRSLGVFEYYKRPCETFPEGLFTVSVNGKTIFADSLPWLHDRHWNPLFRFSMYQSEGQYFGQGTMDLILPLVLSYADIFSAGNFRAKESARMRFLVPDSVGLRHNNDTGHVHYKDKPSSPKPEPITLGAMPSDLSEMRDLTLQMLDRIAGTNDVLRGMNGGAESGVAMSFMEERALGPLRPIVARHARVLDVAIRYAVELAKLKYEDGRMIRLLGENGSVQVREFRVGDTGSGADVKLRAVKDIGRSRASHMQELNEAARNQMIDQETYAKLAEFGELGALYDEKKPHLAMAVQEHETLEHTGDIQQPHITEMHKMHLGEHTKKLNAIKTRDPNSPLIPVLLQHCEVHKQMLGRVMAEGQMYQDMAMQAMQPTAQAFGAANAADPENQSPDVVAQSQGAAVDPSSSPGSAAPSSEPLGQMNPLGESPGYEQAQANINAVGGT